MASTPVAYLSLSAIVVVSLFAFQSYDSDCFFFM